LDFPHNPLDTTEQREHELFALELFDSPELRAVRAEVRDYWLDLAQPSPTMRGCFDAAFEEVMFGAVVWALNRDPLYPRVIAITRLEHEVDGRRIPGSRWGIDNPDSVYRVIPVSGDQRYLIRGRVYERRMVENYFTLWDSAMRTVGLLSGKDLVVDERGNFEIAVDSDPAGDRPNHVRTGADAHEFYIRDVIADWSGDRANVLGVERLGPPPERPPRGRDELVALAGEYMRKWATNTHRWNDQALHKEPNDFSFLIDREDDGAQVGQIYIMGHFRLPGERHAIVLDVDLGGADYFIAPITNIWGTSNDILARNGCLNKVQSRPNEDGTYTFVLSMSDPGVHNWLDPTGMDEGILTLRWAEFAGGRPGDGLGVRSRLVALDDLHVPPRERVSPERRAALGAARASSYAWRLASCRSG